MMRAKYTVRENLLDRLINPGNRTAVSRVSGSKKLLPGPYGSSRYSSHPLYFSGDFPVTGRTSADKMVPVASRRKRCGLDSTISSLITAAESGDSGATDALFVALYAELHRMAKRELARQGAPPSLSVTTLLHEAYIDISGRSGVVSFPDRARFMGYAARVMRGFIIDHARSRDAIKRGGEFQITSADGHEIGSPADPKELSDISDALDQLAKIDPELAELVDLKFFCGLSFAEIAALRNVSERTVQRQWEKARIYLRQSLRPDLPD